MRSAFSCNHRAMTAAPPFDHLIFDACDHGDGTGSWEAMASVMAEALPVVRAQAQAALDDAARRAPGPRGPLDDGGAWDADLSEAPDDGGRVRVVLVITGPWDWGEALVDAWSAGG